jgi:glutaredoxin
MVNEVPWPEMFFLDKMTLVDEIINMIIEGLLKELLGKKVRRSGKGKVMRTKLLWVWWTSALAGICLFLLYGDAMAEWKRLGEFPKGETERVEKAKGATPRSKPETTGEGRPYRDINVIMYMTAWCPYCTKAREYIRSLGVNLVEYNVETDRNKQKEMVQKSGGSRGVPLIDVEGIILKGYSPSAIKAAIERRRNL